MPKKKQGKTPWGGNRLARKGGTGDPTERGEGEVIAGHPAVTGRKGTSREKGGKKKGGV